MFQERGGGNLQSVQEFRRIGIGLGWQGLDHQARDQAAIAMARMRTAGLRHPARRRLGLGKHAQGSARPRRRGTQHKMPRQRRKFMRQWPDPHSSGQNIDVAEGPCPEALRKLRDLNAERNRRSIGRLRRGRIVENRL